MNIEILRSELLPALSAIAGVVERRQTLPILGNVLVRSADGGIGLRATDLELEISSVARVLKADEGEITLPARKLMDICRSLPETARISIKGEGERAVVASSRSRFTLSTLPATDFPSMDVGEPDVVVRVATGVLKRLLEKTAFAMAQQDVRYYLNGVLLELQDDVVRTVATDGHRLAKVSAKLEAPLGRAGNGPLQMIVPAKSVTELKRLLSAEGGEVVLELSERTMRVSLGPTVVASKLVDGRYPDYERVIPKDLPKRAWIDKEPLRAALQRAAILSNEKYKGVRVSFSKGVLALQAHNPEKEQAEDEVEMEYEGETVVVGFNVGYILDVLQVLQQDRVEVCFRDGDSSAVWRGEGAGDEEFVIMPMRL